MAHAILSASASHRWMACTPSARLEEHIADQGSAFASEGTFAHALAELKLRRQIVNDLRPSVFKKQLDEMKKDPLYSTAMEDYIDQYVAWVLERFMEAKKQCPDTLALLEQRLDFSEWVPEGFGTGDVIIISDDTLEIIDLKYGKGVPVSAIDNPQMRLYGLGAIEAYGMLYNFSKVRMSINQPRLDSTSTDEMTADDLLLWADDVLRPKAELAWEGKGEFCAGEHCRFCKIKATCRARAEYNMELARLDFQQPVLLSDEEIGHVLVRAAALHAWVADIEAYALDQVKNHGKQYDGWKLVEGRSNRKYSDAELVAQALLSAGYKEDTIYEKSLLGITAMEKALGKKEFGALLSDLVIKPAGKPVLVPEADKRPAINSLQSALSDFRETA